MKKRALISVSDKAGIEKFALGLTAQGYEIVSTGGTSKLLKDAGINVIDISQITNFPECLDGRVKTLHPAVHGGILAIRDNDNHMKTLKEFNILPIDLVVINLYPFKETILKEGVTLEEAIENIDIGGPAMLRSAAKNYRDVTVVVDPADYDGILKEIQSEGSTALKTRYNLSLKVFRHTSHYDTLIANYLGGGINDFPETITLTYEKLQDLRYGENPHQRASFYREVQREAGGLVDGIQIQGKEMSYNNINDANGALDILKEFTEPTVVAVKHTNPCGVACGIDIKDAYNKTFNADPQSIFGGIIAANRKIDGPTAEAMKEVFLEVIIAPDYTQEALDVFKAKKNIRIIKLENICHKPSSDIEVKKVSGGLLLQERDRDLYSDLKEVTDRKPSEAEMEDLLFAFKIVKHVKSNAIVIAKDKQTLAIGPGQTSRIWALKNAIDNSIHSLEGSVLASDAFFPFGDCVEAAAKVGIAAIIQPGGSLKDVDSIEACNNENISMVFTGMRHFRH